MPATARGDLAVDVADRARHVEAAERRAAVAQLERLARARGRAGGRDRAADGAVRRASLRPRPSAGRGCPRRGARGSSGSSASFIGRAPRARRRAIAPGDRRGSAQQARARRAARASRCGSSVMYSTGDLPSTRASSSPGSSAAARRSSAAARLPVDAARGRPRPARRSRRGSRACAGGVHRHFSSRWLRQKARSNAGSPHHAHSASSSTGPRGPTRMFFGLTSPCTSASCVRLRRARPAPRAPARDRDGARAVASR